MRSSKLLRLDMDLVQINILERMQKSLCKDSSILLNIHLVYICHFTLGYVNDKWSFEKMIRLN
ncbi:hypothetical protein HanXRQr2_Chr15g0700971 [Helianthus annuus]|uniref:Uncharacterized protein n=1 Tax=Helianthus annuus TaxID=4232 RepID=A0A9K3E1P1_HELAN|nr:hypothetical protein HanXRQr2_Chr15g0700971 [Helianthus annuus]KAJ0831911.1 hypothetical protein HanPSC8_Chr15g0672641 [Helianthus annuus]